MSASSEVEPLIERGHDAPQPYIERNPGVGFELLAFIPDAQRPPTEVAEGHHRDEPWGVSGVHGDVRHDGCYVHVSKGERAYHAWLQDRPFARELVRRACRLGRLDPKKAAVQQAFFEDGYSLGAGKQWLELFESGVLGEDDHGLLGPVLALSSDGDKSERWRTPLPGDASFQLELVGVRDAESLRRATELLTFAFGGDEGLAGKVAKLACPPFLGWASPWELLLPEGVEGVRGFDLRLATHRLESDEFCLRNVRLIYGKMWLVTFWGPPEGEHWQEVSGYAALPGRGRPYPGRVKIEDLCGEARCARTIQDMVWHNDWSAVTLAAEVHRWEHDFYEQSEGPLGHRKLAELDRLKRRLGLLGRFVTDLEVAERTMRRRATTLSPFPCDRRDEVLDALVRLRHQAGETRENVRSGFSLLTAMASSEQAASASRFQALLGALTALVLVPGLIVSAYGAEVAGLPGMGDEAGLRIMVAAALVAAAGTLFAVWLHGRWGAKIAEARTGRASDQGREASSVAGAAAKAWPKNDDRVFEPAGSSDL